MNIYDIVTQRRRALSELFDAMNEFMEPTEREKMLLQHKQDMDKMARQSQLDLEKYHLQTTTEFANTLALRKIDFDGKVLEMGLNAYSDILRDNMKYNADLRLARLKLKADEKAQKEAIKLSKEEIEKEKQDNITKEFNEYWSEAAIRQGFSSSAMSQDTVLGMEASKSDDIATGEIQYGVEQTGFTNWAGRLLGEIADETLEYAAWGAGVGASTAAVAGQLPPLTAVPEEIATVPAGAWTGGVIGGGIGTGKAIWDWAWSWEDKNKATALLSSEKYDTYGWIPKSGIDQGYTWKDEEGKLNTIADNMRERKHKNKKGKLVSTYSSEDINEIMTILKVYDFDGAAIVRRALGGVNEKGEFYRSRTLSAIDEWFTEDMKWMVPEITTSDEGDIQALKMPRKYTLKDNAPIYGNMKAIEYALKNQFNDKTIMLVRTLHSEELANQMQYEKEQLQGKRQIYLDFFKEGEQIFKQDGSWSSFTTLSTLLQEVDLQDTDLNPIKKKN